MFECQLQVVPESVYIIGINYDNKDDTDVDKTSEEKFIFSNSLYVYILVRSYIFRIIRKLPSHVSSGIGRA